jgi:Tfp pilus assembly protein PilN
MKAITYLIAPSERLLGVRVSAVVAPSLRRPAATAAFALLLVGLLHGVEESRLAAAIRDGRTANERLQQARANAVSVDEASAELERLGALERRAVQLRESGIARASEVAALGNVLPRDAWLSAIRFDAKGYELEGSVTELAVVGATIAAVTTLRGVSSARLAAVRADRERHVTYSITVQRR